MSTETTIEVDLVNARAKLAQHVSRIAELRQAIHDERALEIIARRLVHRYDMRRKRQKVRAS